MSKKIAVIIVTYNASEYLGELFSSLEKINSPKESYQIIVVDNCSQDDTIERIKNYESRITNLKVIISEKNTGFAEGNNIGLRYAQERNFDYAYLLNQDTVVKPDFLIRAVETAESDERIGEVQSLLMLWPEKELINSWGNEIHFLGLAYTGGYKANIQDSRFKIQEREIAYASGAACLIRLSALNEIGLFNPEFFMYHDDVDLGWRMWLAGYRVVLAPQSVVYHKYEFSRSIKKYYFMLRNGYWVILQNYHWATLLVLLPVFCLMDITMFIFSFMKGFWREQIHAWAYFFKIKNIRQLFICRGRVQAFRKISDREMLQKFTGVIEFQDVANPALTYFFNPLMNLYFWAIKKVIFW